MYTVLHYHKIFTFAEHVGVIVTVCTSIQEIPGSGVDGTLAVVTYRQVFCGFPEFLQADARMVSSLLVYHHVLPVLLIFYHNFHHPYGLPPTVL
jgi:hypothetical protein